MLGFIPDTTSTASPGESNNPASAFSYMMVYGGCPYDKFTPEACNIAVAKWEDAVKAGTVKINYDSFHAANVGQVQPYSIYGNVTPSPALAIGSDAVMNMVRSAASVLGFDVSKIGGSSGDIVTVRDVLQKGGIDVSKIDSSGNPIVTPTVTPTSTTPVNTTNTTSTANNSLAQPNATQNATIPVNTSVTSPNAETPNIISQLGSYIPSLNNIPDWLKYGAGIAIVLGFFYMESAGSGSGSHSGYSRRGRH